MDYAQQLSDFANSLAGSAGRYLAALAAIGALSMAIVQAAKELTDLRARFQRRAFMAWLQRPGRTPPLLSSSRVTVRSNVRIVRVRDFLECAEPWRGRTVEGGAWGRS